MALHASEPFSTSIIYPCDLANSYTFFCKSSFSDLRPPIFLIQPCVTVQLISIFIFIIAVFQKDVKSFLWPVTSYTAPTFRKSPYIQTVFLYLHCQAIPGHCLLFALSYFSSIPYFINPNPIVAILGLKRRLMQKSQSLR